MSGFLDLSVCRFSSGIHFVDLRKNHMTSNAATPDANALPKSFEPEALEARWYAEWENQGYFKGGQHVTPAEGHPSTPFVVQFPPPNVTGTLHMGHAFNQTVMDGLVRYHRMKGDDTVFIPGTDHAGIATQIVVERQLDAQNISRHDLGREKFLETVWAWKNKSGNAITEQFRRLGSSADWAREYFTMDDNLSRGVVEVFVRLYEQGLIPQYPGPDPSSPDVCHDKSGLARRAVRTPRPHHATGCRPW